MVEGQQCHAGQNEPRQQARREQQNGKPYVRPGRYLLGVPTFRELGKIAAFQQSDKNRVSQPSES